MSRDKRIEEMAKLCTDKCRDCHNNECIETTKSQHCIAETLYNAGYRKASEVARETIYDFQNRLRHTFLDMCNYNDYGILNLLQIDSAIDALYDTFIAELKKKYTESEKGNADNNR